MTSYSERDVKGVGLYFSRQLENAQLYFVIYLALTPVQHRIEWEYHMLINRCI